MEFLMNYWYIVVAIIALLVVVGLSIYKFAGLPTKEQTTKIKEWLLYAVTVAESKLGSNTGSLKLRAVYDMFVTKFPVVAKIVSFETFSVWVDEALEEMRKLLETNEHVKNLVNNSAV